MNKNKQQRKKIQKLRDSLKRLKRFRSSAPTPDRRKSWFSRLKDRLGLTRADAESDK